MNNYKIYRDNIYVGIIIKKFTYDLSNDIDFPIPPLTIRYRKILFSKNDDNTATDILYHSPDYNINGLTQIENTRDFHISNVVCLSELLKQYKFSDVPTNTEIKNICKYFLETNNKFVNRDYIFSEMEYEDLKNLKLISDMPLEPSESELEELSKEYSFKPKIKIFTKK